MINKKPKKHKYAEFVSMTEEEHQKLVQQFGEKGAQDRIDNLNLYKGSTGKKYKEDYLTILNWERKNNKVNSNVTPIRGNNHATNQPWFDVGDTTDYNQKKSW